MGLTGALKRIATQVCPHCNKEYGRHSKKGFMKCLYTANYNLYNVVIELNQLKSEQVPAVPTEMNVHGQGKIEIPNKTNVNEKGEVKITPIPVDEDKDKSKDNWTRDLKENQKIATEEDDE